jgi:uncharacterized membrane protein
MTTTPEPSVLPPSVRHPFRGAVLRGLGVVLPPLLTIVIFLWIGGTVQEYLLEPVTSWAERRVVWLIADIRAPADVPAGQQGQQTAFLDGTEYQRLEGGSYVPKAVYDAVRLHATEDPMPRTGNECYRSYVRLTLLRPQWVIPFSLALFILVLYLLGKFMAAGIGRLFWGMVERGILRVPVVRNVYSAVKQVSGFLLNERDMQVSRVVAVQYPRQGVWQIGFVTGPGMPDVEAAAGEECVSVLVCTSPVPMAGFAVNVRRSEVVDLNITIDQAIQFIVSCGVVVPRPKDLARVLSAQGSSQRSASANPSRASGSS